MLLLDGRLAFDDHRLLRRHWLLLLLVFYLIIIKHRLGWRLRGKYLLHLLLLSIGHCRNPLNAIRVLLKQRVRLLVRAQHDARSAWQVDLKVIWPLIHLVWVRLEPDVVGTVKTLVTSEALLVGLEKDEVVRSPESADRIVLVRLRVMEIIDEDEVTLFVHDHLVALVVQGDVLVRLKHGAEKDFRGIHLLVEPVKLRVP